MAKYLGKPAHSEPEQLQNVRGRHTITKAMGPLGTLVREARQAQNMSLRAAGAAAGVSFVTIRDIERGEVQQPSKATLEGLSLGLDIPLADLALAAYGADQSPSQSKAGVTASRTPRRNGRKRKQATA